MNRIACRWVSRGALGYMIMGLIVACGAAWSFGALVEIGNIATERARLTTLPPPAAGYLFAGSVDLFIFYGYLKCYGPPWQIVLAVFHILAGLVTSVWLQYQHSKGAVDPVLVSVIPPLAVAVSLDTWVVSQMVDWYQRSKSAVPQPVTDPDPRLSALPPVPASPPSMRERLPGETQIRPKVAQDAARRERPAALGRPTWHPTNDPKIVALLDEGLTPNAVRNQLGLNDGQYRKLLAYNRQRQLVPNRNGDGP